MFRKSTTAAISLAALATLALSGCNKDTAEAGEPKNLNVSHQPNRAAVLT
ncbi:hypothetical protein GJV52_06710 [Neisseria brasiliensis]|uniref:Uncharacterized protein n=1 Tax=Neisseria brasiliensis TaxID=2666100 RepID=A0A5Q3RZU2_9NEIS|nr:MULTISPECIES: hypothetical protein [Neisseria]MRN38254.1 hypothetical protein [Neisseria brasiliensis]QGL25249.1 hypothetical protein GJV52_06710 [Neisseria brasiliensis]